MLVNASSYVENARCQIESISYLNVTPPAFRGHLHFLWVVSLHSFILRAMLLELSSKHLYFAGVISPWSSHCMPRVNATTVP